MTLNAQQPANFEHLGTKKFHVTLIRPPAIWSAGSLNISSITPPVALAYLSATLRDHGYSVKNIDSIGEGIDQVNRLKRNPKMEAQGLTFDEIIKRIPMNTNVIGISCMFSIEWPAVRDLALEVRRAFPHVTLVMGGEHVTALPEFSMGDCHAIDYIVMGEGEQILLNLLNSLEGGIPIDKIQGIVYRKKCIAFRTLGTPTKPVMDGASGSRIKNLDSLKWPAWDLTCVESYLDRKMSHGRYIGRTMPIIGSRGCPYECTFCSNPSMWGRRYLTRSPADVVEEIIHYKERYQIRAVEFYDLTPIIKKEWIIEFCNQLIEKNVRIAWQISGGTRCEAIDEEVVIKAKLAGCGYIGFAPESGDQEVLNRIKKRIKIPHLMNLIRLCNKHGVDTRCNIVIGFPEDTRLQIYKALWFQMKLAFMGVIDSPVFEFTPYPGSELFDQLRKKKVIPELNDLYFENLGLNVQLNNRLRYCERVSAFELFIYRIMGMCFFYGIYYLLRPKKLFSFISNLISYKNSNSVFEQRIIQNVRKQFGNIF